MGVRAQGVYRTIEQFLHMRAGLSTVFGRLSTENRKSRRSGFTDHTHIWVQNRPYKPLFAAICSSFSSMMSRNLSRACRRSGMPDASKPSLALAFLQALRCSAVKLPLSAARAQVESIGQ